MGINIASQAGYLPYTAAVWYTAAMSAVTSTPYLPFASPICSPFGVASFPVTQASYVLQRNNIECAASVLTMGVRALLGKTLEIDDLTQELSATTRYGTNNLALLRTAQKLFRSMHVHAEMTAAEPKRTSVFTDAPWRTHALRALGAHLQSNAFVIVNYREPVGNDGHYAICQAVTQDKVLLADPKHGPFLEVPLANFDWRSEHNNPTLLGWRLVVHPTHSMLLGEPFPIT